MSLKITVNKLKQLISSINGFEVTTISMWIFL